MLTIKPKVAPTWFAFTADDPPAEILLAPLSSVAWLDVRNELSQDDDGNTTVSGRGMLDAVRDSARDWRNIVDEEGEPIPFDRSRISDLPHNLLFKIALEVMNRARLSEIERKNSSSPSTSG